MTSLIKIGLKVIVVSIVAGMLTGLISAILTGVGMLTENLLVGILFVLLIIPINLYVIGWVATKLWKWK